MFEESSSILASMNSWFTPTVLFILLNLMIGTILLTSNLHHPQHPQDEKPPQSQSDPHHPNKINRSPSVLQRLKSLNLCTFRSQQEIHTLLKQIPDSDTHFHQSLETTATHYVFNQTHDEPTNINTHQEQQTLEMATNYDFEQTHQEISINTDTQYLFQETRQEKSINTNTHYLFKETHEEQEERESEERENCDDVAQSLDEVYSQLTGRHVDRTTSDTKPASGEIPKNHPAKMKKSASLKSAFAHFEEEEIVEARRPATVRERKQVKISEDDDVEVDAKADDFINKFKQQLKLQRIDSIIRNKDMIGRGTAK